MCGEQRFLEHVARALQEQVRSRDDVRERVRPFLKSDVRRWCEHVERELALSGDDSRSAAHIPLLVAELLRTSPASEILEAQRDQRIDGL